MRISKKLLNEIDTLEKALPKTLSREQVADIDRVSSGPAGYKPFLSMYMSQANRDWIFDAVNLGIKKLMLSRITEGALFPWGATHYLPVAMNLPCGHEALSSPEKLANSIAVRLGALLNLAPDIFEAIGAATLRTVRAMSPGGLNDFDRLPAALKNSSGPKP